MPANHTGKACADRRGRTLWWVAAVILAGSMAASGAVGVATSARSHGRTTAPTSPSGPEGIPLQAGALLAPENTAEAGQTVDGIQCDASEHVTYHIHTHLAVYVNGSLRPIPAGIGVVSPVARQTADGPFVVATRCYYWLHVHVQDGIIHVESPTARTYTLGQFFAIWHQPLDTHQVGPARGPVTVFVNGIRYSGDPADITLRSWEEIQMDVGSPVVAPAPVAWHKPSCETPRSDELSQGQVRSGLEVVARQAPARSSPPSPRRPTPGLRANQTYL